jgi:hypothetical protein
MRAASKYWEDVTPLVIKEVCSTCKSDLTIDFVQKDHKDDNPFDGIAHFIAIHLVFWVK